MAPRQGFELSVTFAAEQGFELSVTFAAEQGFEPQFPLSESGVLPLHHSAI